MSYDPVKAHQYYLAHRLLKGKKVTKKLSKEQRMMKMYINHQISEEKKKALLDLKLFYKIERMRLQQMLLLLPPSVRKAEAKSISLRRAFLSHELAVKNKQTRADFKAKKQSELQKIGAL